MRTEKYRYDGTNTFHIDKFDTDDRGEFLSKKDAKKIIQRNLEDTENLRETFYAEAKHGILIIFQAMDAAGKDSAVEHVFSGLNPQGINVFNFKKPSTEEYMHDYLWRVFDKLPRRGMITLFNRSYYENVLIDKVHKLYLKQHLPERCLKGDVIETRYRQIRDFERYLWENGITVVKFFLHVSKEEQAERLLARIENEKKNWKFAEEDLLEREFWQEYQNAYEDAINATATEECPWYVLPSDHKWFARSIISEVLLNTLQTIDPILPELSEDSKSKLSRYQRMLEE